MDCFESLNICHENHKQKRYLRLFKRTRKQIENLCSYKKELDLTPNQALFICCINYLDLGFQKSMKNKKVRFKYVTYFFLLILFLTLFFQNFQNFQNVRLSFLLWGFDLPFVILIAISFIVGFFTAKIFSVKKKNTDKEPKENKT